MKIEFRRDLRHRYLVIYPEENTRFGYRAEMILNNQLVCFMRCFSEELNGRKIFYYEIPAGYCALAACLEQSGATEALYRKLMLFMASAMEELSEYLLEPDEMLLEPEYIFLNEQEMSFVFAYYPETGFSFAQKCTGFSEALLHRIKNEERGAVEIGYLFYRNCVKGSITTESLNEMARSALPDTQWTSSRPQKAETAETSPPVRTQEEEEDYSFLFEQPQNAADGKKERRGLRGIFGRKNKRTRVSGKKKALPEKKDNRYPEKAADNPAEPVPICSPEYRPDSELETVLLNPGDKTVRAWLIPKNAEKEEKIPLEKDQIIIGKSIAGADVFLESAAVSRIHARISWAADTYGIADLGSRNGTTVNGIPIRSGEWIRLKEGDEIGFADRGFVFCAGNSFSDHVHG